VLSIKVNKDEVDFKVTNNMAVTIVIYDKEYVIDDNGLTIAIPDIWRY
jgi:hypothetical protein